MPSRAEEVFYRYLSDVEALDVIVTEGFDLECITTEEMRPVVEWCIERYFESGRMKAPSAEAIRAQWSRVIEDNEIALDDGTEIEDNVEWAIDFLKNQYLYSQWVDWSKKAGREIAEAPWGEKLNVYNEHVNTLASLSMRLASQREHATLMSGIGGRLVAFNQRQQAGVEHEGLTFGLPEVDNHCYGIHTGELAVCAAGPKIGKSWFCCRTAYREWERQRVCVLYTLENSVEATLDRMACHACRIDYREWQRGRCSPEKVLEVETWLHDNAPEMLDNLHIIKPMPGERSMQQMVRQAQILGAQTILIDQLTFVEPPEIRKPRDQQIRDMLHELKTTISTGRHQMAGLLMHQINREGIKAAEKARRLEIYHMAEGAEVERTADWVYGIYSDLTMRASEIALFQILGARREDIATWELNWRPHGGVVSVRRLMPLEEIASR